MNDLLNKIRTQSATAFTHSGKFHADDVFSSALLLYLNPEITILRGNRVPDDFDGIVFDIGRGKYDHHQKDSRIRENGVPYAAFGLLWEELDRRFLAKNWRRNSMKLSCSHLTTMIIPARRRTCYSDRKLQPDLGC